jgi:predicted nucleotidyltransferase
VRSAFHSYLIKYVNVACFSKLDYIQSLVDVSKNYKKYAPKVIRLFKKSSTDEEQINRTETRIEVEPYSGNNNFVLEMSSRLENELKKDLLGAYIHGSLATQEEVEYSDFDALVILKDDVFESEERLASAALKLHRLQRIMHEFDPLQHHGWFVMTESMLENYPILYFPPELFEFSKSLLNNQGLTISIQIDELPHEEFLKPFVQLSNSVLAKLKCVNQPKNSFVLKGLLSEFMLLPALYLQAKYKHGVYKKDSFRLAENDFEKAEWEIMNEVSTIRAEWGYKLSTLQKTILTSRSFLVRKIARRFAPHVASQISIRINHVFFNEMLNLVILMKNKMSL